MKKIKKQDFQNLSNKERAELYADFKPHNEVYFSSQHSFLKRIHGSRLSSIKLLMGDTSQKKVLDAGSGEGYFLSTINAKQKVGIELSEKRIKKAKKLFPNLEIKMGDVNNLPFDDDSFDIIVCSEVLEHVDGYEKAIKEFKRCIKPTGELILSFPNELAVCFGRLLILRFPIHEIDHVNSIKPKDIEKILSKKYVSRNVPNLPFPFCLYQIYKFNAISFK